MNLLLRILAFVNSMNRGKMCCPVTSQDGDRFRETCGSCSHAFEEDAAIKTTSCSQYIVLMKSVHFNSGDSYIFSYL
jgi:hypothetical protein